MRTDLSVNFRRAAVFTYLIHHSALLLPMLYSYINNSMHILATLEISAKMRHSLIIYMYLCGEALSPDVLKAREGLTN
jgi:hypothetical protein